MVPCENCGEKFYSPDEHARHGGPFTCCRRKLKKAADALREVTSWRLRIAAGHLHADERAALDAAFLQAANVLKELPNDD